MGTFITGVILFCIIGLAVHKVYKDRKSGKGCGGCCGNCSGCPGFREEAKNLKN